MKHHIGYRAHLMNSVTKQSVIWTATHSTRRAAIEDLQAAIETGEHHVQAYPFGNKYIQVRKMMIDVITPDEN